MCPVFWLVKGFFKGLVSVSPDLNHIATAAAAKSLQSCSTLCHLIDSSPLGSSVPGILQARVLEWGAIAFSIAVANLQMLQERHQGPL